MKNRIVTFFLFIALMVVLLPVAFIITVLLHPFWRWLENTHDIEEIGHSGPAEWCFLLVYGLVLGLVGCCYRQLKIIAAMVGLLLILIILLPLPHGGSIGEALLHEFSESVMGSRSRQHINRQVRLPGQAVLDESSQSTARRFAGILEFQRKILQGGWQIGTVSGKPAWLDGGSGMIWGERQNISLTGWSQADLRTAMTWCRTIEPRGFWSMPTNAEFALGVKNGMQTIISDIAGRWIAQSHFLESVEPFPSLVGFSGRNANDQKAQTIAVSLRCIGRSTMSPAQGYFRKDISNADAMSLLSR